LAELTVLEISNNPLTSLPEVGLSVQVASS
jgi:hypothetical protein